MTSQRRNGFTLIEMLAALAIVLMLAAIAVAFVPQAMQRSKASDAASRLQGWLLLAKQEAKTYNTPTGICIFPGTDPAHRNTMQIIQQPEDYVSRVVATFSGSPNTTHVDSVVTQAVPGSLTVTISLPTYSGATAGLPIPSGTVDLWNGQSGLTSVGYVQPGDYLEVNGTPVHLITDVPTSNTLTLAAPITVPSTGNISYRVIRQPRVLLGETDMVFGPDAAIDVQRSVLPSPLANPTSPIDIIFNPSGALVGASGKLVCFWVRDISQDGLNGEQVLIAISPTTGFIAAYPADLSDPNAYHFAQQGLSGGM